MAYEQRSRADYRREARERLAGPPGVSTDMQIRVKLASEAVKWRDS